MSEETSEHLTAAIEQLSDDINGLMQVAEEGTLLTQLVAEIKVLREAIDDLRNEVEWAVRNLFQNGDSRPLPEPVTSMPVDPCDPQFAEKLNAHSRHDLPSEEDEEMFDDDAECFREDNGYPLDDEEEGLHDEPSHDEAPPNTPSQPPPSNGVAPIPPTSPPQNPSTSPTAVPSTNRNRQPLATRLYLHRHLEALVRLVGHEEHLAEDFQCMVQPLFEKFGTETVKEAIDELVSFSHRDKQAFARLKPEVARLAVQIIGRPQAAKAT